MPTDAEQVAIEAIRVACFKAPFATSSTEWRGRIERILSDYRDALRANPAALADLNGGEWAWVADVRELVIEQRNRVARHERTRGQLSDGKVYIFVPRPTENGDQSKE